jgi:hypothetical protein
MNITIPDGIPIICGGTLVLNSGKRSVSSKCFLYDFITYTWNENGSSPSAFHYAGFDYSRSWGLGKSEDICGKLDNGAPSLAMPRRWRTVLKENKAEKIP